MPDTDEKLTPDTPKDDADCDESESSGVVTDSKLEGSDD